MSLAATLLATFALALAFWNRSPGFGKLPTLVFAYAAYAATWLASAFLLPQVYNAPILRLAALHLAAGAIGIPGLIGIVDFRDGWWVWPAAAVTFGYPLTLCALRLWR